MSASPFDETTLALAERAVRAAVSAGVTLGCAESCTGGLVCAALTCISGSSAAVRGSVVSYDPAVKHGLLGVSNTIIDDPSVGVVSAECAAAMCVGAREALECDIAVSITGRAGPGGAEPGKPVGTVWFGLATPRGVHTSMRSIDGDRDAVRNGAVRYALELLCGGIAESRGVSGC